MFLTQCAVYTISQKQNMEIQKDSIMRTSKRNNHREKSHHFDGVLSRIWNFLQLTWNTWDFKFSCSHDFSWDFSICDHDTSGVGTFDPAITRFYTFCKNVKNSLTTGASLSTFHNLCILREKSLVLIYVESIKLNTLTASYLLWENSQFAIFISTSHVEWW